MSKTKLTRKTISIRVSDCYGNDTLEPVKAWVHDDILAFYKSVTNKWVLTHVPTGFKIGVFDGKYSGLRTLMTILVRLKVNWLINNPVTLLNTLEQNKPYDAYGFIRFLLCDAIDLNAVLTLMTDDYNLRDVLAQIDKIMYS